MKKSFLIALAFLPLCTIAQNLTETSNINISQNWSQELDGYTYPIGIHVPTGTVPEDGFPICILLHGNGGNGSAMVTQFEDILSCHVLVAPTGYQNMWNLCAEDSDAPDVEMMNELVDTLQTYSNINPNKIRVLGVSNGAGLANRVFIENTNAGIDIVCAVISQMNEPQYHLGNFYQPTDITDPSSEYCGYDNQTDLLNSREYISICNDNDPIIPYEGGTSVVGVDFLPAETAAYIIAQHRGYSGEQLTGIAVANGNLFRTSYPSQNVLHLKGDAGHSINTSQKEYINDLFSDCVMLTGLEEYEIDKIKVYPNPFRSIINVERTSSKTTSYTIFNTLGKAVINNTASSKTIQIDLTNLPMNIYFLKIDNQVIKFTKQN